jgi:uncharacterized membrane protein
VSLRPGWTDQQVEIVVGRLLQIGVSLAAAVVLVGGIEFLVRHGAEPIDYRTFREEPADLRTFWGITSNAIAFRSRGLIQAGLLLLIATPIARVVVTLIAFIRQRDTIYVVATLIVLAILLYGLLSGYFGL